MPSVPDFDPASLRLDLGAYLDQVADVVRDSFSEPGIDHERIGLFQVVRWLKAHPDLVHLDAEGAFNRLAQVRGGFATLADMAFPEGNREGFAVGEVDDEDVDVAFYDMWERVRFPIDVDPVEAACGLAGSGALKTQKTRPGKYARFLTVAAILQLQVGSGSIYLPVHKLAKHMRCQANSVSAWRRWAVEDGVLLETKAHSFRSAGGSEATEFILGLHLWISSAIEDLAQRIGVVARQRDRDWLAAEFARRRGEIAAP